MSTDKPKVRYLKNAWAKKDEDGDYWLFIEGGGLHAMFCLSECLDLDADENSIVKRALDSWIADQDSTNGNLRTN